eukprot:scaffold8060_cov110-Cylindrotheca_fusiformis.AAC.6
MVASVNTRPIVNRPRLTYIERRTDSIRHCLHANKSRAYIPVEESIPNQETIGERATMADETP